MIVVRAVFVEYLGAKWTGSGSHKRHVCLLVCTSCWLNNNLDAISTSETEQFQDAHFTHHTGSSIISTKYTIFIQKYQEDISFIGDLLILSPYSEIILRFCNNLWQFGGTGILETVWNMHIQMRFDLLNDGRIQWLPRDVKPYIYTEKNIWTTLKTIVSIKYSH